MSAAKASAGASWSPANYSPDTIKLTSGAAGAIVSNLMGIPLDRFRVLVAQDVSSLKPMPAHFGETFKSPASAFVGGTARVTMKSGAAVLNLYIPHEWRTDYPFLSSFVAGAAFAPLLNIPRMFQLGKIGGDPYPQTFRRLFTSFAGIKTYLHNTAVFAPGEGLRMMMCFGTKDFLMSRIGGNVDPSTVSVPLHAAKMALIAGPVVSAVETSAAVVTETLTTVHAHVTAKNATMAGAHGGTASANTSLGAILKNSITPKYTSRCFTSLLFKNCGANTPLFWLMFMGDLYSKQTTKHHQPHEGICAAEIVDHAMPHKH